MSEWIDVNKILPAMFEDVIVIGRNRKENILKHIYQARRFTGITGGFDVEKEKLWQWITPCDGVLEDVTYWMAIPSLSLFNCWCKYPKDIRVSENYIYPMNKNLEKRFGDPKFCPFCGNILSEF